MSRDIRDRLLLFLYGDGHDGDRFQVERIALNMDQVELYSPPPNPAKITDSSRRDGDPKAAEDAEAAAIDYLLAADELEAEAGAEVPS
jgi:hypothetical protein